MLRQTTRRALMAHAAALSGLAGLGACASSDAPAAPRAPRADALGDLDAVGVAARIRAGEITAQEALEAAIARTALVNPQLNFMAAELFEMARTRAAGPLSGPFAGVPTLIKDLTALTGAPLRYGSRAFAANVASAQPPYVDALMRAGLVPFGKSTTPEFGFTATTEPLLGGPTRNPWNVAHSAGGSSGGAAAAVASCAVPIAHASDGGGSIRIPASCCGLVGLKVSRGRLIREEQPADPISIAVDGCLSRTVRDTAAWLAVTEQNGSGAPFAPVGFVSGPSERRLRIGLKIADARGRAPHADVAAATEAAAAHCARLGHSVSEARIAIDGAGFEAAFFTLWAAGAAEIVQSVRAAAPDAPIDQLLEPLTLGLAAEYAAAPPGALEEAVAALRLYERQYAAMFSDFDVLLTPVLAAPPPRVGELAPDLPMEVGFARVREYVAYTPLENAAGAPAMSLPLGESRDGLPVGAHFAAAQGQERLLLELAYELEMARPWAQRRPSVWAG